MYIILYYIGIIQVPRQVDCRYLMCSLQPERGVGTHRVVELMGEELAADVDPEEVVLGSRQVPGCVRAGGVKVQAHVCRCRFHRAVLPLEQLAVEEHGEVGDAGQTRDGLVTGRLQDLYGRLQQPLMVVPPPG